MKNFFLGVDQNGSGIHYLKQKFPNLNKAKIKEEIYVHSQIRQPMTYSTFDETLSEVERGDWREFKAVTKNFLINFRACL
jgi:hypothetical protein